MRTERLHVVILAALCWLIATGCATYLPAPAPAFMAPEYTVGAPDKLRVTVLPDPIIINDVVVRPDGMITVELIGEVRASGRTPNDIAAEVQKRMARFKRDARATVSVAQAMSAQVTVYGEVGGPGTFPLERETRVAEAIGLRGGASNFASKGKVRIVRPGLDKTEVIRVNLSAIEQGDLTTNVMLREGDIVIVPPTLLAQIGYGVHAVLFPLSPIISAMAGAGIATLF